MNIRVIIAGTCMAIAVSSYSAPSIAAPVTIQETKATTSSARIHSMMRRMDRFHNRVSTDASRLYVSRDNNQRVAQLQQNGSYRLNR